MSLNSFSFVIFLPLAAGINFILPKKYRYIWLCAASLLFYLSNDVRFAAGLILCIVTTYITGLLLEKLSSFPKKILLALCIVVNVSALFLFRYSFLKSVFVPIGMSFYALQAMGYVIDVYRKQVEAEKNPVRYAVYVAFFPTVISGPIQRATGLLQQIREGRDFDYDKAHSGLYYLLWGYLLKIVMANQLGRMVDFAYGSYETVPGATLLWATILYAIQLYCDFAGYSALAIGAGKILGFDIAENFAQPYFAVSVKDFWKRWHISLSSWLKDYVYIPLGGNRKGRVRKCINLMLTFVVSGVWHGSGVNFLVWGALHGAYQVVGNIIPKKKGREEKRISRLVCGILTFALVDFAWLFFRADSLTQAVTILRRIIFDFDLKTMTFYGSYLLGGTKLNLVLMLLGICMVFFVDFLHEKKISIERMAADRVNIVFRWVLYVVLTLLLLFVIVSNYGQTASTFIYERF